MRAVHLSLLTLAFACTSASADDNPFAKVPKDAEVHVVTIREPFYKCVTKSEILDWQKLATNLCADSPLARHLRKCGSGDIGENLADELQQLNLGLQERKAAETILRARLSAETYLMISRPKFYDAKAFADVKLPKAVKELVELGDKRTLFQTKRLNRELLDVLFPDCIAATPRDFQTTSATVKAGKPVVLVLCSYQQCRWSVTVEKGATVAAVFLFGNSAQELEGTEAPVYYGAWELPNGMASGRENLWFGTGPFAE